MVLSRRELIAAAGRLSLLLGIPLSRTVYGTPNKTTAATRSSSTATLSGKFGSALNAAWSGAESDRAVPAYKTFPLTVEFWCKLEPIPLTYNFIWTQNILVANEPIESCDHWAIYLEKWVDPDNPSAVKYGTLCARFPGMIPEVFKSAKVIADGQWHYVAMTVADGTVALYADAEELLRTAFAKNSGGMPISGLLTVGKANLAGGGSLDFNGVIDDLRLSNIARDIRETPTAPLTADTHTIGLWSFDHVGTDNAFLDASSAKTSLRLSSAASLDEIDRDSYRAGPSPFDSPATEISLQITEETPLTVAPAFSLEGLWRLVEGDTADWSKSIEAAVPGSVHTALHEAGVIPFPYHGRNQETAKKYSQKTYWYKKVFPRPPQRMDRKLIFYGVCHRCTIWLNGTELGQHEGMLTRIELPISEVLQDSNTLLVKLDAALDWKKTVVPPVFYGPYYTQIPPLGIWRTVEIRGEPPIELLDPLIATRDTRTGLVELHVRLAGPPSGWNGTLTGIITPESFQGPSYSFEHAIISESADKDVHLRFNIPDPHIWWPVDMGSPDLYRLTLTFVRSGDGTPVVRTTTFGIRTVSLEPVNGSPRPRWYNWTFVVNGKPAFIKGTNWCTPDAMMEFSRGRYERLLRLAANQHVQMLRVWGFGMIETDDFYDQCDRLGLLVMQEWPTTGNAHKQQPLGLFEATVRENTLRLRNHPSLAIYSGANESTSPFSPVIDMMGRLSIELDGTRPFHRTQPRGGSTNDYAENIGGLDQAFSMESVFYGEVGYSYSYPNYESMRKLLPVSEQDLWPAPADGAFVYKTRVINSQSDWSQMVQASRLFTNGATMERFIVGTQLAQAVGVRHILERARTRWPECTGALYFKFNEVAPTAERTAVDWYGVPKIPYYFIQRSLKPLVAVAVFPKSVIYGEPLSLPLHLLDDSGSLRGAQWRVTIRAYDSALKLIKLSHYSGSGSPEASTRLGEFTLAPEQTRTAPLLVVTDVLRDSELGQRNYYFINFSIVSDCLFNLPRTQIAMETGHGEIIVRNKGELPAVGVNVSRPGHQDMFTASESYFWLDPGESRSIAVDTIDGAAVEAWNA